MSIELVMQVFHGSGDCWKIVYNAYLSTQSLLCSIFYKVEWLSEK